MKQRINPIYLMNRPAHKIVQRVGQRTWLRSSGRGGRTPDFIAFGPDSSGKLSIQAKGEGTYTWSRSTGAYITDYEGTVIECKPEEFRFDLTRRVENLLTETEDFSQAAWIKVGTATVTGTNILNFPAVGDRVEQDVTVSVKVGMVFGFAVKLTGPGAISIQIGRAGAGVSEQTEKTVTLSNTAQRFFISHTFANEQTGVRVQIWRSSAGLTSQLIANQAQTENLTGQSNQNPGEYVSSGVLALPYHGVNVDSVAAYATQNGNLVDVDGVVTDSRGDEITTDWGALFEPQRANTILQSEDFTLASYWTTASTDTTTLKSSVFSAIKGVFWWRLQALAGGTSTWRYILSGTQTKPAEAQFLTCTLYAERYAAQVSWLRLRVRDASATASVSQFYDLENGVIGTFDATTWSHVSSSMTEVSPGTYRLQLTLLTDAGTSVRSEISLAEADGDVTMNLNAADGLYIQGVHLQHSTVATSYIPTSGTEVTRTADKPARFDIANWSQQEGTWYTDVWFSNVGTTELERNVIFNTVEQLYGQIVETGSFPTTFDGTDSTNLSGQVDYNNNLGQRINIAIDFGTNSTKEIGSKNITLDEARIWGAPVSNYDGAYDVTAGEIIIGYQVPTPLKIRNMSGFKSRKGKYWVELNL